MKFIKAFLIFWRGSGAVARPEWTLADAKGLAAFMASSTGRKLDRTMLSEICVANERAAMSAKPFECGWACGYRGLYAWFQALSATPAAVESGQNDEDPFGEDDFVARSSP